MRLSVWTLTFLLFNSLLFAQDTSDLTAMSSQTRRLARDTDRSLSKIELKKYETERGVTQLIALHQKSLASARPQIREQLEKSLYTLFDLNLELLQQESRRMKFQLDQLETKTDSRTGAAEIDRLRRALNAVEGRISFRQENRVQIVSARLNELLEQG